MKKYTISEIKEQGIWVKCNTESDKGKFKNAILDRKDCGGGGYIYYRYNTNYVSDYECQDNTPPSFIEFNQIDWEDKKQIGWRLKKECEHLRDAAIKICNVDRFQLNSNRDFDIDSGSEDSLKLAGVIELWFVPVYKEVKFKIGDYCLGTWDDGDKDYFIVSKILKDGLINSGCYRVYANGELANMTIHNDFKDETDHDFDDERCTVTVISEQEFLAAKNKVLAAEKIEIWGYEVIFDLCHNRLTNKDYYTTTISGFKFIKEFWEAALIVSKHTKAKIKIGCSHQFDLPTETIERILSKLK